MGQDVNQRLYFIVMIIKGERHRDQELRKTWDTAIVLARSWARVMRQANTKEQEKINLSFVFNKNKN